MYPRNLTIEVLGAGFQLIARNNSGVVKNEKTKTSNDG
jgi:hypothetical protein